MVSPPEVPRNASRGKGKGRARYDGGNRRGQGQYRGRYPVESPPRYGKLSGGHTEATAPVLVA